jgi:hypothetical protein
MMPEKNKDAALALPVERLIMHIKRCEIPIQTGPEPTDEDPDFFGG